MFKDISSVPHDTPVPLAGIDLAAVLGALSLKNPPILKESKAA